MSGAKVTRRGDFGGAIGEGGWSVASTGVGVGG